MTIPKIENWGSINDWSGWNSWSHDGAYYAIRIRLLSEAERDAGLRHLLKAASKAQRVAMILDQNRIEHRFNLERQRARARRELLWVA